MSDDETELVNGNTYDGNAELTWIDRRSKWGNPFKLKKDGGDYTRPESIDAYREWFNEQIETDREFREATDDLEGETLACHCKPEACHGDVILEYLRDDETPDPETERKRLARRCDDAELTAIRFIDVQDGEKGTRTPGHQQPENWLAPDDAALSGNYGVHPGKGLIEIDDDDYDADHRDVLDALPETLAVESPHTSDESPGHLYYAVTDDALDVLKATCSTVNPDLPWGEIKYEGKYVVGPGSQLDGCTKEWCDECAKPDGGYYRIVRDVPIATLDEDTMRELLGADNEDDTPTTTPETPETPEVPDLSDEEKKEYRDLTEEQVEDALGYVDESLGFKEWLNIGFAVYDWNSGATGKRVFESWSKSNAKWEPCDQNNINDIWDNDSANGSVEMGTLVHHAKEGGWNVPVTSEPQGESDGNTFSEQSLVNAILDEPSAWIDPEDKTITAHAVEDYDGDKVVEMFRNCDLPDSIRADLAVRLNGDYGNAIKDWYMSGGDGWTVEANETGPTWSQAQREYAPGDYADSDLGRYYATTLTMGALSIVTNRESEHVYCYDETRGVYAEDGKQSIKEVLIDGLKHRYKPSRGNNIVEQIRPQTYKTTGELGGPAGLICVGNGVLDLATRERFEHSPEHLFLSDYNTDYDSAVECPTWKRYIKEVVHSDDVEKLQEYAGYCLMHWDQPYKKALLLLGPQDSGKSTFLNVLITILGGYENVSSEPVEKLSDSEFHRARLFDKHANIHNDLDGEVLENVGMFKTLTGNDEQVSAAFKHEDGFEFEPNTKLVFAANRAPRAKNAEDVFYDRWVNISFPDTIPVAEQNEDLLDELLDERAGILNWMLDGYDRLTEQGGFTGERSLDEKRDFWASFGRSVDRFVHNCIITQYDKTDSDTPTVKPGDHVPKAVVQQVYGAFCNDRNLDPVGSKSKFTRALKTVNGITDGQNRYDGKLTETYRGIRLDTDALDALDLDRETLYETALDRDGDDDESGDTETNKGGGSLTDYTTDNDNNSDE
jgi:putative DNA primase/helicase